MDSSPTAPAAAAPPSTEMSLGAELRGTVLLFLLTLVVTAGVALFANLVVSAVG